MPADLAQAFDLAVAVFSGSTSETLALSAASPAALRLLGLDDRQDGLPAVSAAHVLVGRTIEGQEGTPSSEQADLRARLDDLASRTSALAWGEGVVLDYWAGEGGHRELRRAEVLVTASSSSPPPSPDSSPTSYSILFLRPAPSPPSSTSLPQSPPLAGAVLTSTPSLSSVHAFDAATTSPPFQRSRSDTSSHLYDTSARSSQKRPSFSSPSGVSIRTESSDGSAGAKRRVVTGEDRVKLPLTPDVTSALALATSQITDTGAGTLSPPSSLASHPLDSSRSRDFPSAPSSVSDSSIGVTAVAPLDPADPSSSSSSSSSAARARSRLPHVLQDPSARRPSIDASLISLSREVDANAGTVPHYRLPINDADASGDDISPAVADQPNPFETTAKAPSSEGDPPRPSDVSITTTEADHPASAAQAQAVEDALEMRQRDARPPLTLTQLTNLIETMPYIAFIADPAGQVLWLSRAWFTYTGQDPAYNPSFEEWITMFHPDDLQQAFAVYLGSMKSGEDFSFEYRVKGKDGILRWHQACGRAYRVDGEISAWYCNVAPIDELVKTRHDALLVKERTKAVLEGSDLTLLTIDVNLKITFFEGRYPPFDFKANPPKLVGEPFHELCADEDLREGVRKVLDDEEAIVQLETATSDGKGGKRFTRYRLVALRGDPAIPSSHADANAITGCIAVGVDISERVRAEEALESSRIKASELAASEHAAREANRLKTEFLTTISHEIRTPIAGILGICELLLADSARLDKDQRALVEKAVRSGEILLDLVGAVLDVRKVETGELTLEAAPFTLSDVLADARLFAVIAQKKALEFREDIGPVYQGTLLGDRLRLRQVLANALGNSVKFTRQGSVTLSLQQISEDDLRVVVKFVITDTGVGIDEHVLPTLFRPFKQASAGTAREYGGSGLGLTIAKNLVEMMHGSIELKSELGAGSRMTILIPFSKAPLVDVVDFDGTARDVPLEDAAAADKLHRQEERVTECRKRRRPEDVRILLAEDNELIREIFVVDAVENGQEAVEQVHQQEYSIVLMDGQMPGMDGYEATKLIRRSSDPRIRNLRIIALTASAIAGDRERCLHAGMSTYLAKPVRAKEVRAASSTDSGTPAPNIAPATQVVPSIGLDGKPTTPASPSSDNGGNHFPTAAAVVVGIFAGLLGLYLVYKLYRWRTRRWTGQVTEEEPPQPETRTLYSTSPMSAGFATLPSQMSVAFNAGGMDSLGRRSTSGMGTLARSRQASWGGESWGGFGEKSDFSPSPTYAGTPITPGTPTREDLPGSMNASRASLGAFPSSASRGSFSAAPPRRPFYSSSASGSQLLHSRAASTFSVSSPHLAGASNVRDFPSGNRLSGAPHNPASRIEVVPPLPLAPPPGTVIATDKSTLDFAPSSGIGRGGAADVGGEEWSAAAAAAAAAGQPYLGGEDYEERLNPAFDGAYGRVQPPPLQQHSFPPSASSSAGSSRASSSVPRSARRASKRPSQPHLRATGASANSSDSNLSSASGGSGAPPPLAPPVPAPTHRTHPHLTVRTSSLGLREQAEARSPLEALQIRAEREAQDLGGARGAPGEGARRQ
ncbi:hypothetical protein JCM10450v2_006481 [Rhodotorula kratochvilovae]